MFAGGRGTRLNPLTETIPKPLVKVNGKPLIQWNMERVNKAVDKYLIVISHLGDQIIDFFGYSFEGVPIEYVWQYNPKGGTLDALRTALYESSNPEHLTANYLIQNCDDIHGEETFKNIFDHIDLKPQIACLMAKVVNDKEKIKSFGVFRVNKDGMFIEVVEKPQEFVSNLANIAVSYFPNKMIRYVPEKIDSSEKESYITDMYNSYSKTNPIQIISTDDTWIPIASIADLDYANLMYQ